MATSDRAPLMQGRLSIVLVLVLTLGGCSLFPDRAERYQAEPYGEPLQVPEGKSTERLTSRYPIPEALAVEDARQQRGRRDRFELPSPPDLTGDILEQNYAVEESGDQTWLLVNDVPGRVWPAVSAFMNEQGVSVVYENPRTGIKQSPVLNYRQRARDWLALDDSDDEDQKVLQFRIAHGVRARSSEVQVRLLSLEEEPDAVVNWVDEAQDEERERRILEDMVSFFSDTEDTRAYSRVALDLPREEAVRLDTEDGQVEALELELSYDRAWFEVSQALSSAEVPVVDINRSEGLWFVDFRDPDDRGRRWLFWRESWDPEFTFLLTLNTEEGVSRVRAEPAPDYEGDDRSQELLRTLHNKLQ